MKLITASVLALFSYWAECTYADNMAYVEVNSNKLENIKCYMNTETRKPFFQMASIFAANINGTDPDEPVVYLNNQVSQTLESTQIQILHNKGIKVLLTLLGNHQNAGWACMTDSIAAKRFANEVVSLVNKYDLDGIDIDDEYSQCVPNTYSMIMLTQAIKEHPGFKNKLLTKALYKDLPYFEAVYQGHTLSDYLDYGWEMTYNKGNFMSRLSPYLKSGMTESKLMIGGYTANSYPDPLEIGKFTEKNQLAGVMAYDVKNDSDYYLSQLLKGMKGDDVGVKVLLGCMDNSNPS